MVECVEAAERRLLIAEIDGEQTEESERKWREGDSDGFFCVCHSYEGF